jgi:two-component SAPR family response regulator
MLKDTEADRLLTNDKTNFPPDYIFIDINVPKMTVIELLLLIKER